MRTVRVVEQGWRVAAHRHRRDPDDPGRRSTVTVCLRQLPRAAVALAVLATVAVGGASAFPAGQGATYFVDTTMDDVESQDHCQPGAPCPLRSAVYQANMGGGGTVTARVCDGPDDVGCLSTQDPNYDPDTGRWTFYLDSILGALIMDREGVALDFTAGLDAWSGAEDNIAVLHGGPGIVQGVVIQGIGHTVKGMEFTGAFASAAIEVSDTAHGHELGPGLVFAGTEGRAALRLRDPRVTGNKVVGIVCGAGADGRLVPVEGHCLLIERGANHNVIGGEPADRNILAAASGAGIMLAGPGGDANVVRGNLFGDLGSGVGALAGPGMHLTDASDNEIAGNVFAGIDGTAIRVDGTSFGNRIAENDIGFLRAAGEPAGNAGWGVELTGFTKGTAVRANTIRHNAAGGIRVRGGGAENNLLTRNLVTGNDGPGILVSGGANGGVQAPRFSIVSEDRATGTSCGGCTVEVFSDDGSQAAVYEGSVEATAGTFIFDKPAGFRGPFLTATTTESGNTSSLSEPRAVPGVPTPTPARSPAPPAPEIYLPWAGQEAVQGLRLAR